MKCATSLKDFAPDSVALGTIYFFLGTNMVSLKNYKEAMTYFGLALGTTWASINLSNKTKCLFARGKIYQLLGDHVNSLMNFAELITHDSGHAHALFRRGWLYKVCNCDFYADFYCSLFIYFI